MKLHIAYQKNSLNYDAEYNDVEMTNCKLDLKGAIIAKDSLIVILRRREAKKISELFFK